MKLEIKIKRCETVTKEYTMNGYPTVGGRLFSSAKNPKQVKEQVDEIQVEG
jgi:hypothetical protein